jgi:hypothetical protein
MLNVNLGCFVVDGVLHAGRGAVRRSRHRRLRQATAADFHARVVLRRAAAARLRVLQELQGARDAQSARLPRLHQRPPRHRHPRGLRTPPQRRHHVSYLQFVGSKKSLRIVLMQNAKVSDQHGQGHSGHHPERAAKGGWIAGR